MQQDFPSEPSKISSEIAWPCQMVVKPFHGASFRPEFWLIMVLHECSLIRTLSFIVQQVGTLGLDLGGGGIVLG